MSTPLELMREFTMKGKMVELDDEAGVVKFGSVVFPKDIETNFKGQNGKYYKLEDIWFLLQHRDRPWVEYMRQCNSFKFAIVSLLDHKDAVGYLTGKIETSKKIDPNHVPTVKKAPAKVAKAVVDENLVKQQQQQQVSVDSTNAVELEKAGGKQGGVRVETEAEAEAEAEAMDIGADVEIEYGGYDAAAPIEDMDVGPEELTEKQKKGLKRKQDVIERDEEEVLRLGQEREMKLGEILADEKMVEEIRSRERPLVTRKSQLDSENRTFKHILNYMTLRAEKGRYLMRPTNEERKRGKYSNASSSRSKSGSKRKASKKDKGKRPLPIIIVPAAATSALTIANARAFLEKGVWESPLQRKPGSRPSGKIGFFRISQNEDGEEEKAMYEIVDSTRHFTDYHWKRVVAVFVHGKKWQFKGWKLGEPSDMFAKVAGFYVGCVGDKVPESIQNWNVHKIFIDKHRRHMDTIAQKQFWEVIDSKPAQLPELKLK